MQLELRHPFSIDSTALSVLVVNVFSRERGEASCSTWLFWPLAQFFFFHVAPLPLKGFKSRRSNDGGRAWVTLSLLTFCHLLTALTLLLVNVIDTVVSVLSVTDPCF